MVTLLIYWIAELNNSDVSLLRSKFIKPNDKYPQDALHMFAENAPAHIYAYFNSIENQWYKIDAKDHIPKNISSTKIESILKSDSHLPKKVFCLHHWKPFKNDEKLFIFHLKSSLRSQDI